MKATITLATVALTLTGCVVAPRPVYVQPQPIVVEPAPIVVVPVCHWERRWDAHRSVWYNVKICR